MVKSCTLKELAALVQGEVVGNGDLSIHGLNGLEYAAADEITFITSLKKIGALAECKAAAVIVPSDCGSIDLPCIKVKNPDLAAAVIHNHFLAGTFTARGIHPHAFIGRECRIPEEVTIGPLVCIGDRVTVGEKVTLQPGVVIGSDCVIGDETVLHANVSIADHTLIGKRVIIHAGASIGSDGFGYATDQNGRHIKKPQVGNVQIDDDVEIGANSCIDRAAFGTTRIKSGVKIDNLVMVAHNVEVGENSILTSQVGISGSTTLGKNVVLGGKAGLAGHLYIADRVMVAAKSGVHSNLGAGSVVAGYPAIDIAKWRRATVSFARLPEMIKEMKLLRKQVDLLTAQLQELESDKAQEREGE
jgi:UDP-3-O-[3-hydroxymyristoyl] glucosamine N-acyltransferase